MAWLNLTMSNQTVKNGLKAKKIKLPLMNFFLKKLIKFSCTYWLLSLCKILKKILRADPELWGCAIFGPKMAHLPWKKLFWYKPSLLLSSTYWTFPLCKILKNSYSASRVKRMRHFWAQNGPFAQKNFLENYWYHSHLPISPFHWAKF